MKPKLFALMGLVLACGTSQAFAAQQDALSKAKYVCKGNNLLEVVYINTAAGNSYAIIHQRDEMIPMKLMKMASGANYAAINKNYTYRLYTKGKSATLEGDDKPILSDCMMTN